MPWPDANDETKIMIERVERHNKSMVYLSLLHSIPLPTMTNFKRNSAFFWIIFWKIILNWRMYGFLEVSTGEFTFAFFSVVIHFFFLKDLTFSGISLHDRYGFFPPWLEWEASPSSPILARKGNQFSSQISSPMVTDSRHGIPVGISS